MPLRTILILVVLGAIALFAALNWEAFAAPTTLRLGFGTVEAPLGLIMLGLTALLAFLFLVFVTYLQTSVLIEGRRHARELEAQRELLSDPKPRVILSYDNFFRRNYASFQTRISKDRRGDSSETGSARPRPARQYRAVRKYPGGLYGRS